MGCAPADASVTRWCHCPSLRHWPGYRSFLVLVGGGAHDEGVTVDATDRVAAAFFVPVPVMKMVCQPVPRGRVGVVVTADGSRVLVDVGLLPRRRCMTRWMPALRPLMYFHVTAVPLNVKAVAAEASTWWTRSCRPRRSVVGHVPRVAWWSRRSCSPRGVGTHQRRGVGVGGRLEGVVVGQEARWRRRSWSCSSVMTIVW